MTFNALYYFRRRQAGQRQLVAISPASLARLVLPVIALVCGGAHGQPKATQLADLEKLDQYQRAIDASRKLEALADEQSRARSLACMKAFGHSVLCKCLGDSLPFGFSFNDYVAITTQTKEQNGYAKLDKDLQKAYNAVGPIRDKCVRESFK